MECYPNRKSQAAFPKSEELSLARECLRRIFAGGKAV